jgi:hypothetical protein
MDASWRARAKRRHVTYEQREEEVDQLGEQASTDRSDTHRLSALADHPHRAHRKAPPIKPAACDGAPRHAQIRSLARHQPSSVPEARRRSRLASAESARMPRSNGR